MVSLPVRRWVVWCVRAKPNRRRRTRVKGPAGPQPRRSGSWASPLARATSACTTSSPSSPRPAAGLHHDDVDRDPVLGEQHAAGSATGSTARTGCAPAPGGRPTPGWPPRSRGAARAASTLPRNEPGPSTTRSSGRPARARPPTSRRSGSGGSRRTSQIPPAASTATCPTISAPPPVRPTRSTGSVGGRHDGGGDAEGGAEDGRRRLQVADLVDQRRQQQVAGRVTGELVDGGPSLQGRGQRRVAGCGEGGDAAAEVAHRGQARRGAAAAGRCCRRRRPPTPPPSARWPTSGRPAPSPPGRGPHRWRRRRRPLHVGRSRCETGGRVAVGAQPLGDGLGDGDGPVATAGAPEGDGQVAAALVLAGQGGPRRGGRRPARGTTTPSSWPST